MDNSSFDIQYNDDEQIVRSILDRMIDGLNVFQGPISYFWTPSRIQEVSIVIWLRRFLCRHGYHLPISTP